MSFNRMQHNPSDNENVDNSEIAKFQGLANQWWDKEGDMKPLHDINPLRANFIDRYGKVAGKNVLDLGCGAGILSEGLAFRGANVTGIDMASDVIEVAKLHLLESKCEIDYKLISAEALAKTHAGHFDVICCMEMLEHVPEPESVIQACATLCKPGGDLFFSTINRNLKAFMMAIVGAEYILRLIPKGTHHYEKLIKPSELAQWCRQAKLDVKHMQGLGYNPITKHYSLTQDTSVNYLVHVTKAL